jgi:atypical dual specificity phosphatase
MRGFYWVIDGLLAGCPRPGGREARGHPCGSKKAGLAEEGDRLDDALTWLEAHGVGAILSMTETPLAAEILAKHPLTVRHLPVPDMTPPTTGQLRCALEFIDEQHALGKAVVVHCLMGQGRTGTVLAAYLIRGGASAAEALRTVRGVCAGAVGSPSQERALSTFAERRDWIV